MGISFDKKNKKTIFARLKMGLVKSSGFCFWF